MEKTTNGPAWAKILYAMAALAAIVAVAPAKAQTTSTSSDVTWFDDALPAGARSAGGTWNWVRSNPTPFSGTAAHQSPVTSGLNEQSFNWANPLNILAGDKLFFHVYLDPNSPPREIMVHWNSGNWEHRAYWGENMINYGKVDSAGRRNMGALPAKGQWVRLEVPAALVGLEGKAVKGMTFSQYGGRATWDKVGRAPKSTSTGTTTTTGDTTTTGTTVTVVATKNIANEGGGNATLVFSRTGATTASLTVPFTLSGTATKWNDYRTDKGSMPVEIVIPAGATSATMNIVAVADTIVEGSETAIFTVSANSAYALGSPSAAIIAINDAGVTTPPPALPGSTDGGTTDGTTTAGPTVSVTATKNIANEGGGNATLVFSRTGATTSAVTVPFSLSGTATKWTDYRTDLGSMPVEIIIPIGATSATMNIVAVVDTIAEGSETAIFTLAAPAGYTLAAPSAAIIAINDAGVTTPPPALPGSTDGGSTGGTTTPPPTTTELTVSLTATDAVATEGGTDNALLTFSRTGATTSAVTVPFSLSGTATKWTDYRTDKGSMPVDIIIPAGASSAIMGIVAVSDTETEKDETAIFTLTAPAGYTLGSPSSATITIKDPASTGGTGDTTTPPATTDPTSPPPTDSTGTITPSSGSIAVVDYTTLEMPQVGDHALKIVSPDMVELRLINTKEQTSAPTMWNFVSSNTFNAPATSNFAVTVNGQAVSVSAVGFRRRPLYVPLQVRDLRIDNSMFLRLNTTIPVNATVEVKNPTNSLWPSTMTFKTVAEPMRESGVIHVNQEGYAPNLPKKAMVGYFLGSFGELDIPASAGFQIVEAATGKVMFNGSLVSRKETGYTYTPLPYQKVMEADFTAFTTPGEYRLLVPGYGASLPFLINDGVPMAFMRTYALGLYHQRCGHPNHLPFTRHVHDSCHTALVSIIPDTSSSWAVIASESSKKNPNQTAPQLKDPASMLYPFVNKGPIDVSGGHHDAGDYSKYTNNSALLVSSLIFAVDSMPGLAQLDNLGLPESGDGISDLLQEAKIEADFLAKMQDADGGFYFLVYPANRRYESNVLPDKGDPQIVWPKTTSVTAASVAALAQMASSPKFKAAYPTQAANYLAKAKLGWTFLMNAIAKHGKTGSYQKITHYGDNFMHDDELAWAAVEMYLATGETQYANKIKEWFPDPTNSATFRWGWWRMYESYGNAVRSYAFANRSGRSVTLDATYLAKCDQVIIAAGDETVRWAKIGAYPTSFPDNTKRMRTSGWFFSLDHAMDIAVAHVISPKADYIDALVGNMNYEGGTNPVNVSFITGLGTKRQREIVHQYTQNDRRVLPMTGIPQGNIVASFAYLDKYGSELGQMVFPSDDNAATPTYPFYDRWADAYNVTTEFVHVNQSRAIVALAALTNLTQAKSTAWKSTTVSIVAPTSVVQVGSLVELKLNSSLSLNGARIVWEAREQEPAYGPTYTIQPISTGEQWVEVEVQWPDGRRAFAHGKFNADADVLTWVDDAVPAGAKTSVVGGDSWNWVTSSPTPKSGKTAHKTLPGSTGIREHSFTGAYSPMDVSTGDTLFAYVYLDPTTPPTEIMLHWFDGTSWDHRAYWGANSIHYGTNDTAGRRNMGALPAKGQWVRLEIPASAVGLEGRKVYGMCFSTYAGGATWDLTGRAKSGKTLP